MRLAYASETYEQAKRKLGALKNELRLMNQSAANSLEEGLEETLMLHRLGVFKELGISFKTTNMIESVFSQVGQFTDRVDCWKNSSQRQRWLAASLLEIEKRLRKVKGYKHLPMLRQKMESQSLQMQRLCA
jgi:transposase-like protein